MLPCRAEASGVPWQKAAVSSSMPHPRGTMNCTVVCSSLLGSGDGSSEAGVKKRVGQGESCW